MHSWLSQNRTASGFGCLAACHGTHLRFRSLVRAALFLQRPICLLCALRRCQHVLVLALQRKQRVLGAAVLLALLLQVPY